MTGWSVCHCNGCCDGGVGRVCVTSAWGLCGRLRIPASVRDILFCHLTQPEVTTDENEPYACCITAK